MATLNPLVDLTGQVSRQTLFDLWSTSAFGSVRFSELDEGFSPVVVGSTFSDVPAGPGPGQLFWHLTDNVMFCWHDEIEGTGVSLWLAIGPDKFEVAAVAAEPMPAAYPCELVRDRWVRITSNPMLCIGFNQSGINDMKTINTGVLNAEGVTEWGGDTTPSGVWIRLGVDGILAGKIDYASSTASNGLVLWSHKELIGLDPDPTRKGSLVSCQSVNLPLFDPVGLDVEFAVPEDDTAGGITEPSYVVPIQFAPRNHKQFF